MRDEDAKHWAKRQFVDLGPRPFYDAGALADGSEHAEPVRESQRRKAKRYISIEKTLAYCRPRLLCFT